MKMCFRSSANMCVEVLGERQDDRRIEVIANGLPLWELTYPDLLRSPLVVLAIKRRWSKEAAQFVRLLARSRGRSALPACARPQCTWSWIGNQLAD